MSHTNKITFLDLDTDYQNNTFPDPNSALDEPDGLLAIGGELSTQRLINAYQHGIFPWYNDDSPILWWSPKQRAILFPEYYQPNKRFLREYKHADVSITLNHAFEQVITACSLREEETWIDQQMINAYVQLHTIGLAHSVEVWHENNLVGGLYGVQQGAIFCGESMFSHQTNASKFALYVFFTHFLKHGGKLIDSQVLNSHTQFLGAKKIPRDQFLQLLSALQTINILSECWQPQVLR